MIVNCWWINQNCSFQITKTNLLRKEGVKCMNKQQQQAEFNHLVSLLKEVLIEEKDQPVVTDGFSGLRYALPGVIVYNYAGGYDESFCMDGGKAIVLHSKVLRSDSEPITLDSVKSSEFKTLFMNGHQVGSGRDSAYVVSTEKIYAAALVVADFLSGIEKAANQELGWKSKKAGVDFYLAKILGLNEATELMNQLKQLTSGSNSGKYSTDNEPSSAWYANKELIESFWIFGKDRRADIFERRTGITIPSSNKEMPLLKAEIDRILTPLPYKQENKSTLLGDVINFDDIKRKIGVC